MSVIIIHFCTHKQIDILEKFFSPFDILVFRWPLANDEWIEERLRVSTPQWIKEMRKRVYTKELQ